jgi:farnesyl-diphosphate farnesyltransferase
MAETADQLLGQLLRDVSRSFYLTLRALPGSIRAQIGLAYLLARTTDTIADTEWVPLEQRLRSLQTLRERIMGTSGAPIDLGALARHQGAAAERRLLERCEDSLALLQQLDPADQRLIQETLRLITSGQELDLRWFARASIDQAVALQSDEELEDYTYRVAGCVGEFWTRMCRAHVFPGARLKDSLLLEQAVRFGKGLQLVNILRDLRSDLLKGRCYLPADALARAGLSPADLLQPANFGRLGPIFEHYLERAEGYLAAGWSYTNALPWRAARVRLACAWPILIGQRTIHLLRAANVLESRQPVKISRSAVRRIIAVSVFLYPWPALWRGLFRVPVEQ